MCNFRGDLPHPHPRKPPKGSRQGDCSSSKYPSTKGPSPNHSSSKGLCSQCPSSNDSSTKYSCSDIPNTNNSWPQVGPGESFEHEISVYEWFEYKQSLHRISRSQRIQVVQNIELRVQNFVPHNCPESLVIRPPSGNPGLKDCTRPSDRPWHGC